MEFNLEYVESEDNVSFRAGFEQCVTADDKHTTNICSPQHYHFNNTDINQLDCEPVPVISDDHTYNVMNRSYMCHEVKDSGSFPTVRRNSLRGRRRYRKTLLRNYEQQAFQSTQGESSFTDLNDGLDSNFQRRAYLRNQVVSNTGPGINTQIFKSNNNYDGYPKTTKPSWDGGRLVKLLQGHGLNIDNYESGTISSKNWHPKQDPVQSKQPGYSNEYEEIGPLTNGGDVINPDYLGNGGFGILTPNTEGIRELDQMHSYTYNFNEQRQSLIANNKQDVYVHASEKENFEVRCSIDTQLNLPIAGQASAITGACTTYPTNADKIANEKRFILQEPRISMNNSGNGVHGSSEEATVTLNTEDQVNTNTRVVLYSEIPGKKLTSQSISSNLSYPHYSTSHEELFITLGDTPTSKSSYNIANIFVPNQE